MKELFVYTDIQLTAITLDDMFEVQFSTEGSNKHTRELKTQTQWRDFLQDLEGI